MLQRQSRRELQRAVMELQRSGFSDDEIVTWLIEPEPSIGEAPIAALRAGRKSLVRRVAQSVG